MNTITSGIFSAFEMFMKIVKLNLIWLLFVAAGLVIFSLFPATVAAFTVTNKWVKGNSDIPIWNTFITAFKENYVKSQFLGIIIAVGYFILVIDIQLFLSFKNSFIGNGLTILLGIVFMLFTITNLYILPLLIELELSIAETYKKAFYTSVSFLHWTLINLAGVAATIIITLRFPASFIFLTVAGTILWLTCLNQIVKRKIEMKYINLKGLTKEM